MQDIRYAIRLWLRSPGHTGTALLALAIGIGATVAVFSIVYAVLYRPLPVTEVDRVVVPVGTNAARGFERASVPYADFEDWRAERDLFEAVAIYHPMDRDLAGTDAPERVTTLNVTDGYFEVLLASPRLGRLLTAADHEAGAARTAVLADDLWRRRFGADPGVIGTDIRIGGRLVTVVGVADGAGLWPRDIDVWLPLQPALFSEDTRTRRDNMIFQSLARLGPGVSLEQGRARVAAVAARVAQDHPESRSGWSTNLLPLREYMVEPEVRVGLLVLLGGVVFVLLIACVNLANLLLVRGADRVREMALRSSLGASRARLFRQLVTESLLLAVLGGGAGTLLASWLIDGLVLLAPADLPLVEPIRMDAASLFAALGVTVATGLIFGLAPALAGTANVRASALRDGARGAGAGAGRSRTRDILVAAEVALAVMLLAGAGLMLRSFGHLLGLDPGVDVDRVLTGQIALDGERYEEPATRAAFYDRLTEALASHRGIEAAAAGSFVPAGGGGLGLGRVFLLEGQPEPPASADHPAMWNVVTPDFFRVLGMQVIRGRAFSDRDGPDAPPVMIVNETMARRVFGDADPIGRRMRSWRDENVLREIVGVVSDVRHFGLGDEDRSLVYVPHRQDAWGSLMVVTRAAGDPARAAALLRDEVARLDPNVAVARLAPLAARAADSIAPQRFSAVLLGLFAGAAALLAGIGIYGVVTYAVARRTHELGVRLALGATPGRLVALVVGRAFQVALVGGLIGLAGAIGAARLLRELLFGVGPLDAPTLVGVPLAAVAVVLVACIVPARRTMQIDPMTALRAE